MSEWQTESGLFTDYEGVVIDSWFQQGQSGNQEAHWKMQTDSPDVPEQEERWGCGKDWVSPDGGRTVTKKGRQSFNKNSGYGKVIDKAVEVLGGEDKAGEMLGDSPRVANVWVGTKWFFEEFSDSFQDRVTGEKREFSYNLPTKFLGKVDTSSLHPVQQGSMPVTNGANPLDALPEKDQIMLKMYAGQMDFDGWVDKLLEYVGNNDLLNTEAGNTLLGASDTVYQELRA